MPTLDLLTGKMIPDKPKRKKSARLPEAKVGDAVDAFLYSIGAYVRTIKTTGTLRNGKWTRSSQGKGISDRIGVLNNGRAICVELKAQGKKRTVTDEQIYFLLNYAKRGAVACVADCVEDVQVALTQSKEEMIETLNSFLERNHKVNNEPLFP